MKKYMVFLTYSDGFDILEQSGKNRDDVVHGLRNLGFKVSLIISKSIYEGYQNTDPEIFFNVYPTLFGIDKKKKVLEIMYGKGEGNG